MIDVKICTKCSIEKPLSDFNKDKYSKTGYTFKCMVCFSEERKENRKSIKIKDAKYKLDNPNYQKEYRSKNKDVLRAKSKVYRDSNKDSLYDKKKEYIKNNKEVVAARHHKYYITNKDDIKS